MQNSEDRTMTDKLIELAERCEAATGPDREIDTLIGYAVDLPTEDAQLPRYTASLDAALTLVPEGWTFANLSQSDRKGWWCELRQGYLTSYDKVAFGSQLENASPALAVAAAALRARADQ
jgi:hypothetical protein